MGEQGHNLTHNSDLEEHLCLSYLLVLMINWYIYRVFLFLCFCFPEEVVGEKFGFEEIVSREIMSSVTLLLPRKIFIFMFCH